MQDAPPVVEFSVEDLWDASWTMSRALAVTTTESVTTHFMEFLVTMKLCNMQLPK